MVIEGSGKVCVMKIYLPDGIEIELSREYLRISNSATKSILIITERDHRELSGAQRIRDFVKALNFMLDVMQ